MTPGAPRVLVAHPFPDLYGADLMLVRSLEALLAAGWEVRVVVPEDGPLLDRLSERGIDHVVVPFTVLRKGLLSPAGLVRLARECLRDLPRLRGLLTGFRPDVVYVNTLTMPVWLWAARRAGVPSVCHVRELESQVPRPVRAGLTAPLRLARAVVANSEATRRFVLENHPGLAARTTVVYNGFRFPDDPDDPDDPDATPGARTPGTVPPSSPARRRLLVVGRLSPRKGQDLAVAALGELVRQGQDVELALVGSTFTGYEWFERDLRAQAEQLGVADRVHLLGYRSEVWDELGAADVVLVPSRLEPFGSVAVEALAAGRPTVVSDVGGLPEIVRHEQTGLVVPADDVPALVAALTVLLDEAGPAAAWAARGREDVRSRFAFSRYARELQLTLSSAAGASPG